MKNYLLFALLHVNIILFAQQGSVGINTDKPTARLDVHTNGNTYSTLGLKMHNSSSSSATFELHDNGYLGINIAPTTVLDVFGSNIGNDLLIEKPTMTTTFNGTPIKPSFRHVSYATGGSYNNSHFGGQLMIFDVGYPAANDAVTEGIYLVPANPTVTAGIYLGSNRFNGFSLNRLPTTDLDVGGSIRLREYSSTITADTPCVSNRAGEILYSKGHFFGCRFNTWKQLDN